MSIVSLSEITNFIDIDNQYFKITAGNDVLILTSSEGGPRNIDVADGTYSGDGLATALQTAMNADTTLTGGSITFAVSYSSSTDKFTIDATAGNTIAYTHSGSDAGYTFGFDSDKDAAQTITSDNAAGDPTDIVSNIKTAVEEFIQDSYCKRTFESTSYSKERYSGNGNEIINLRQYPVTIVDRVCIGEIAAVKLTNTSPGTWATASVDSTGVRLVKDGTANTDVTWSSYSTIATVVAAINAVGSGWSASVADSSYSSFLSSELITRSAASCIDSTYVWLYIPNDAESGITVDLNRGQIRKYGGFESGFNNVFVDYTAGYSSSNMPEDLKMAVKILTQFVYERRTDSTWGTAMTNIGASGASGMRQEFEKFEVPKEVKMILDRHKRVLV